jgi:DNA mismatch repair protein MSH3
MVEMSETSDILKTCTPRTLVVLDECRSTFPLMILVIELLYKVGRGTSTFDGVSECIYVCFNTFKAVHHQMSIAYAVLKYLVESAGCKTLFITHYPLVASEIARLYREVTNEHMGFIEEILTGEYYCFRAATGGH